tara:strand:+ start:27517 stop:28308 length:792 start_codon:yes stop_codon:yes gene_type:complete
MTITIFTSNQPRHLSLIKELSKISKTVYAVIEVTTIFPGKIKDFFNNSIVMNEYFEKVRNSEKKFFGDITFLPSNVKPIIIKSGDLNNLKLNLISEGLHSDKYIVFGTSYIKSPLVDFLIDKKAYNIHMGVSPYYRGSSCNFWASYNGDFSLIGSTIHMLSKGLDSGPILFHCLPQYEENIFDFSMRSVLSAHKGIVEMIKSKRIDSFEKHPQNKSSEIFYSKKIDFNDKVVSEYLSEIKFQKFNKKNLVNSDKSIYINPFFY